MNFIEAVQALKDGRCEGIRRDSTKIYNIDFEMYFATDWELVGEIPQTETVEVVRWQCLDCGYIEGAGRVQSPNSCCRNSERVELRGSYERPVKTKVKRRENVSHLNSYPILPIDSKPLPNTLRLFAEWEE